MDLQIVTAIALAFLTGGVGLEAFKRLVPSVDRAQDAQEKFRTDLMSELDDLRNQITNMRVGHASEMGVMQGRVDALTTEVAFWRDRYQELKIAHEILKIRTGLITVDETGSEGKT